jgi:hypothetical protein
VTSISRMNEYHRGDDGHIYELWYPASTWQWGIGDLTQPRDSAAPSQIVPDAAGDPTAYITDI